MFFKNPIHEKINYSGYSKIQLRYFHCGSDAMTEQIKFLDYKKCHPMILEYFRKHKSMK